MREGGGITGFGRNAKGKHDGEAQDPRQVPLLAHRYLLAEVAESYARQPVERSVVLICESKTSSRVAKQLHGIFDAPAAPEVRKRLHEFAQGLGRQVPEALRCLEDGFAAATAHVWADRRYLQLPE